MIWGFAGISGSFLVAAFIVNQLHAAASVYRLAFSQRAPRNARPHEVGGGRTVRLRWFHAGIHVLHGRVCLPPGDHTCGWTTSTLHSHLAWRYRFRWGCGAELTTAYPDRITPYL